MATLKLNLTIQQGATFTKSINWYGGGKVCHPIVGVTTGCLTTIEVTGHGLPSGDTPVTIAGVKGAKDLNRENVLATYVDGDNFTVFIDTIGKTYTPSTGSVTYFAPKNVAGFTARMDIRDTLESTTPIVSLVSPTNIAINTANAEITVTISAAATAAFDFDEAVYDLEMEDGTGAVTRLLEGKVFLSDEVTRP